MKNKKRIKRNEINNLFREAQKNLGEKIYEIFFSDHITAVDKNTLSQILKNDPFMGHPNSQSCLYEQIPYTFFKENEAEKVDNVDSQSSFRNH